MEKGKNFKNRSRRRAGIWMLFGIPFLLFICGIGLISVFSWNYLKQAYFLSRLFIQDEYKSTNLSAITIEKNKTANLPAVTIEEDKTTNIPNVTVNVPNVTVKKKAIKFPSLGEEFGNLIIESAGINYPVIHGDRDKDLLRGIGHFDGSRYPGENGNVVLVGHRETVFKNLGKVKKDDKIIFDTSYGRYIYKVSEIKIVDAGDVNVIAPSKIEKLTLYTCYPFNTIGFMPKRYIVIGELIEGTSLKELLLKEGGSS